MSQQGADDGLAIAPIRFAGIVTIVVTRRVQRLGTVAHQVLHDEFLAIVAGNETAQFLKHRIVLDQRAHFLHEVVDL
jgi:hypothetical protein